MPTTIQEWETYIRQLAGPALRSKAIAANTQCFVAALKADGMTMGDINQVMVMFVRQMAVTGIAIPGGGVFDMPAMAELDPIVQRDAGTVDPRRVAEMVANPPPEVDLEDVWQEDLA